MDLENISNTNDKNGLNEKQQNSFMYKNILLLIVITLGIYLSFRFKA